MWLAKTIYIVVEKVVQKIERSNTYTDQLSISSHLRWNWHAEGADYAIYIVVWWDLTRA